MSPAPSPPRSSTPTRPVGPLRRALTAWVWRGAPDLVTRAVLWAIRHDARWSAYYDAGRQLEVVAGGDALGAPQLDHLEAMLFAELDRRSPQASTRAWLRGGAVVIPVAAALAVLVTTRTEPPPAPEPLAPPGAPIDTPAYAERGQKAVPPAGLRVHCLTSGGERVIVATEVGPREPLAALACPAGGLLGFSVTNLHDEEIYLFVVGLAGHDVRWYAPFTSRATSVRVAPGTRDRPLDVLADTAPFAQDEAITLYALFSSRPLTGAEIERQLEASARSRRLDAALGRLPIATDWQGRIELQASSPPSSSPASGGDEPP